METGGNHLPEQRTGAKLTVLELVIQDFNGEQNSVQADQVGRLERAHPVLETTLEDFVYHLRGSDFFLYQKDRFIDGQHQDPVRNKSRRVTDHDGFLAHETEQPGRGSDGFITGVVTADDLNRSLQRHRIHKMHTQHLRRPVRECGDTGDGDGGGVSGKNARRRANYIQPPIYFGFGFQLLRNIFNHKVGFAQNVISGRDLDMAEDFFRSAAGIFLKQALETNVVSDLLECGLQNGIRDIDQQGAQPALRESMGQPHAHNSGADNTYSFQADHAGLFARIFTLNQRQMRRHYLLSISDISVSSMPSIMVSNVSSTNSAIPDTVVDFRSASRGNSIWKASRSSAATRIARSEFPPNRRNSS